VVRGVPVVALAGGETMQKKLIVGLGLVMMAALGAGACSSSSSPAAPSGDGGPEMDATAGDSGLDAGPAMDTGMPVTDAPAEAAEMEAAADGGDAATPSEAGGGDAGDGAVGDAE
jgi:hypothetical protein